ncbi:Holliday junction resolvase RuvX [Kosmotoga pacifica]|uniref:Holliday junction resolvase RuvX n=1 Tax=Kosmotoga pacifica TaxID=1330330 RepID=UPI0009E53186|nr:Holliday junction resolvase RuvX [Kosmotoga pacifica]
MIVLGIDYGDSKIGLALSSGTFSTPLTVIAHAGYKKKLLEIIKEKAVEQIVVGLPISMSGRYSNSSMKAVAFAEKIKKITSLPVFMVDERLSTAFANNIMKLSGMDRKLEDAVSAADILDRYLKSPSMSYEIKEAFPTCVVDTSKLSGYSVLIYAPPSPYIKGLEALECKCLDIFCEHPQIYLHLKSKGFLPKNLRDEIDFSCYDIIVIGKGFNEELLNFSGVLLKFRCP